MSKSLKRIVAVAAAAKLIDKVQEMRRPKRSPRARVVPVVLALAAGGSIAYLAATGRLGPLAARARSLLEGESAPFEPSSQHQHEIRLEADIPTAATAPSPTTPVTPR